MRFTALCGLAAVTALILGLAVPVSAAMPPAPTLQAR